MSTVIFLSIKTPMMHTETRSYPLEECFEHIRESLALALPSRGLTDPILGTDRRLVVAGGLAGPDKTILLSAWAAWWSS